LPARNGYGVMHFALNDSRFFGYWSNEKMIGNGFLIAKDFTCQADWVDGKVQGNATLYVSKLDHVIQGNLFGDPVSGSMEIRQGTLKFGNLEESLSSNKRSYVFRGDQWMTFTNQPKYLNFRKSEKAKALEEAFVSKSGEFKVQANAIDLDLFKVFCDILTCNTHSIGHMLSQFVVLFNQLHNMKVQNVKPSWENAANDIHAFIVCIANHSLRQFKSLYVDESSVENLVGIVSDHLFPGVYDTLFACCMEAYKEDNALFVSKLQDFQKMKSEKQMEIIGLHQKFWQHDSNNENKTLLSAIVKLEEIISCRTPLQKLECLAQVMKEADIYLKLTSPNTAFGADDLLPCVCFVITQAKLDSFSAHMNFTEEFLNECPRNGSFEYALTQFQIAFSYLKQVELVEKSEVISSIKSSPYCITAEFSKTKKQDPYKPIGSVRDIFNLKPEGKTSSKSTSNFSNTFTSSYGSVPSNDDADNHNRSIATKVAIFENKARPREQLPASPNATLRNLSSMKKSKEQRS